MRTAVERATANYIRPKDGEACFYLGVALRNQHVGIPAALVDEVHRGTVPDSRTWIATQARRQATMLDAAANAFHQAVWDPKWQAAGYLELARISSLLTKPHEALEMIDRSLAANPRNPKALNLKSALLRQLERWDEARLIARQSLALDELDAGARAERFLVARRIARGGDGLPIDGLSAYLGLDVSGWLELAADYAGAGLLREAMSMLASAPSSPAGHPHPLIDFHSAFYAFQAERFTPAAEFTARAETNREDFVVAFPFQAESILALERAAYDRTKPVGARAPYHLGCLLHDHQPAIAIEAWEESRRRDDKFALTHRNLGLAYAQHEKDVPKAIASLEKAVELDPNEPRFFYELDLQFEAAGTPVAKRLDLLARHHDAVTGRDDALTREIMLLTVAGQADRALELLRGRHFRNWEGSSQIHNVYVDACLAHGHQLLTEKKPQHALSAFQAAREYPENLEVGRARRSPRTAQIEYLVGTAHEALGDATAAKAAFEKAAGGKAGGSSEADYFHALALTKLGRPEEAKRVFERLVKTGEEQLTRGEAADYFAKFGERQSDRVRQANAHHLIALGKSGLGEQANAETHIRQALELHPAHLGARLLHRRGEN
jgi:tetratricopeptide (TPR) repeat protein